LFNAAPAKSDTSNKRFPALPNRQSKCLSFAQFAGDVIRRKVTNSTRNNRAKPDVFVSCLNIYYPASASQKLKLFRKFKFQGSLKCPVFLQKNWTFPTNRRYNKTNENL
jgi:hypothetical protein